MSRDILIPLAIRCEATTCGECGNRKGNRCVVFDGKLTMGPEGPQRLVRCLQAEEMARGDWEGKLRGAGTPSLAETVTPPFGAQAQEIFDKAERMRDTLLEMLEHVAEAMKTIGVASEGARANFIELHTKYNAHIPLVSTLLSISREYNSLHFRAVELLKKMPVVSTLPGSTEYALAVSVIVEELAKGRA